MEKEDFKKKLKNKATQFNLNLDETQLEQFYQYMRLLQDWNNKMNLTAIVEDEDILYKHFVDSLSIFSYIKENDKILDVGTGAGFPGIPLNIISKDNSFTLLDSLNKRVIFLKEVIKELKLENIMAIHSRAEEFNKREYYDVVTSRAVAKLNVLLEYMLPFTKVGGRCICMKSAEIEKEINESEKAIEILGGKIEKVEEFILEGLDIKRKIVIIQKVKKTSEKYPRKPGTPTKEPIC